MARPSAKWTGLEAVDVGSPGYDQILSLLSTGNFQYLGQRSIDVRRVINQHAPRDVACTIELKRFTSGFKNAVFEVAFSDGVYWIARVQFGVTSEDQEADRIAFESEITTTKLVRERTIIPVPKIYDHETSRQSPFGFPYMLMEYLPGHSLDGPLATSVPRDHLEKVATQFANILFELQTVARGQIGRLCKHIGDERQLDVIAMDWHALPGPLNSSVEFFHAEAAQTIQEAMANHPGDLEWTTACWMVKFVLGHFVTSERIQGPFPLSHLDLHYGNLLFDDDYNLIGIIDWRNAQTASIERMAMSPELMIFPGRSEAENEPIRRFRQLVVEALENKEYNSHSRTPSRRDSNSLSAFIGSDRYDIAYRCIFSNPYQILYMGRLIAKLIFRDQISWEQLVAVYGNRSLSGL